MRLARHTLFVLACLLGMPVAGARAQERQVLLTSAVDDLNTHAWGVYRNANDEILLVHVPPRDASTRGLVPTEAADPGTLQATRPLGHKFPLALAAIGERVYLIYPKAYAQTRQIMRVYSGTAVPGPVGSVWSFLPVDRFDAGPPIETPGVLVDFTATGKALWALLDEGGHSRLLTLDAEAWREVELPPAPAGSRPGWRLSAVGDELILIDHGAERLVPLTFDAQAGRWSGGDWEPIERPAGDYRILGGERGMTLVSWDEQGRAALSAWTRSGVFTIASGLALPIDAAYAVLDSVNELLAIRALPSPNRAVNPANPANPATDSGGERTPGAMTDPTREAEPGASERARGADPAASVAIWELDLGDGSVIYQGSPISRAPVSVNEFRFLVGMMVLVMVGVLVVVIMPDRPDAMRVPDGFALADPGRRLMATLFDAGLVAVLMGQLFHVHPAEIITLSVIVRTDDAWAVVPATMVTAVALMSLFERTLGATPGKLLMGIRVARAMPGPLRRPPCWAVLVRNVIKWVLPPVAALALVDPETLHRGDRATRTLVVVPVRGPSPEGDADSP